jgi:hypothetical protein
MAMDPMLIRSFINYCDNNRILLLVFPPHSTHTLQPLDVVMFKPLSTAYLAQVATQMENSQGLVSLSKRDFLPCFKAAWERSFTEANIKQAFEATGLYPFNPSVILEKMNVRRAQPSEQAHDPDPTSWQQREQLLETAAARRGDRTTRQLARELFATTARVSLLEQRVEGLETALVSEKRRRKRGKPLPTEVLDGGTAFWTPRKVEKARDYLAQQQEELELNELERLEAIHLREEAKLERARQAEEKRAHRVTEKIQREQRRAAEASDKAARKAAREAAQRLREAVKTSQLGNQRSLKAPARNKVKKRAPRRRVEHVELPRALPPAPPTQATRTRQINTPARYR